jgi:hypothetical protein
MPRFGRKETFIASHYTHGFPQSPVSFHNIQPLTWGTFMAYGNPDLGFTASKLLTPNRMMQSTLRKQNSNLAVYDLYDAVNYLDDWTGSSRYITGMNDVRAISTWPAVSILAANNSSATLKTAWFIKLAGLIMVDPELVTAGDNLSEAGYKQGETPGSANLSSDISNTYKRAVDLITGSSKYASRGASSTNVQRILTELRRGLSSKDVAARVDQAKKDEGITKKDIPTESGGDKETPCKDTWMGKIPGYCDYQTAMKIAGAVFIGGVALWGVTKIVKQAKKAKAEIAAPASNPRRNGRGARVRGNPSAPGEMSTEPERKIARMTKGRLQEKHLANTVFRTENS